MSDFFRVFTSFCAENRYLIIIKQGEGEIRDLRLQIRNLNRSLAPAFAGMTTFLRIWHGFGENFIFL